MIKHKFIWGIFMLYKLYGSEDNAILKKETKEIFHTKEYFLHRLRIEKQRAELYNETLSVVLLNLKALKYERTKKTTEFTSDIANSVFSLVRNADVAAWYSNIKIVVLLCDTQFSGAQKFIKRLNKQLLSNVPEKYSENVDLVGKIRINVFSYPENFDNKDNNLQKDIKLRDINLLKPVYLDGQF